MTESSILPSRGDARSRWLVALWLGFGLLLGSRALQAEEAGHALMASESSISDPASLQRGAQLFFNNCVGCHSLKYLRYSRLAADTGLTEQQVMTDLNFTGARFDDPVISRMPAELATHWFGKPPPDLSLEVSAKGSDWVYTFLNSYYLDPQVPLGWNNALMPHVSMPFPLWKLQGLQTAVMKPGTDHVEKLTLASPGTLTPAQFEQASRDLTNCLEYVSEPAALQRRHYAVWVLLFLVLFTLLAFLLKQEYWKDVH
jgi:ubiquinol-cytochrome c reductase cytochrome c1 subunit